MIVKKIVCACFIMLAFCGHLSAQTKIDRSEVFQEPLSEGWTKMIMLKNGNTFYFHYGGKKGIETFVWDKNKKLINKTAITSTKWEGGKRKNVEICGLYEINGEPVIFLNYTEKMTPALYRLRINPADGRLLKEELINQMPKLRMADVRHGFNSDDYIQNIVVEKDAESDNYAVILCNRGKKMDRRIKVQLFDGSHKVISSATYACPDPAFKELNFIGAVVDGDKRVFIATYGAESAKKGRNSHVFISCLHTGDTVFTNKSIDFTEDFQNTNSQMVYNRNTNMIVILTNTVTEKESSGTKFASFLSYIDPETLALNAVHEVTNENVNYYTHNSLGTDINYKGVPQKVILNGDNTMTILQEAMTVESVYHKSNLVAMYTVLGNVGIIEIGIDGKEKGGYALMKRQMYGGELAPLYMAGRDKGLSPNAPYSSRYIDDNLFMSYEYIHTPASNYVLFNDNPKNDKKAEDKKRRKVTVNTDYINTICYKLKDGTATRTYLFGEPEKKNISKACYIETSYFDRKTNSYVTVESDQHGLKYESRVAWIHFD